MMSSGNQKISSRQAFYIILGGIIGDAFLFLPRNAVNIGGQNGWFVSLLISFLILISVTVVGKLALRFPKATIIEGSGEILGKWGGKLYSLILVLTYASTTLVVVRTMPFLVKLSIMPEAPFGFIVATYLFVCAVGAYWGIEVVGRLNEVLMPIVVLLLLVILAAAIRNADFEQLRPFFYGFQWKNFLSPDALSIYYSSSAYILLFMVVPHVLKPKDALPAAQKAVIFSGLVYAIGIAVTIAVLSTAVIRANVWPTVRLVTAVGFRGFLVERIDIFFAFAWLIAAYTTALNFFYATVDSTRRFLGLGDNRRIFIIIPWCILIFAASFFIKDYGQQGKLSFVMGLIMLVTGFFLSALLFMIAKFRGKGEDVHGEPQKAQQSR